MVVLTIILIGDLLLIRLRPHIPSTKESTLWVVFYVGLALLFAVLLGNVGGWQNAGDFITGWALEYSLSIDNLFVFVLIMAQFAVPRRLQQQVLMVGIIIALILRGLFILAGVAIVENFSPIFYIFGAFLIWTAITRARCSARTSSSACCVAASTSARRTTGPRSAPRSTASACGRPW